MLSRHCLALAFALSMMAPAAAQDASMTACESQQEMEQVIQSDGDLMPDGCRTLNVTSIDSGSGELCVLDFEAADPGVLDALQEQVTTTQWWVACAELTSR
jgi:hypothetical protein